MRPRVLEGTDAPAPPSAAAVPVYWPTARREIARVLSWQDRESASRSYGCFDRTYWCWKFTDFPGARFQEGAFTLAYLFTTALAGNPLYRDPRALRWIEAGLGFWRRIQRRDGSFDEAYPFEHSLAADLTGINFLFEILNILALYLMMSTKF